MKRTMYVLRREDGKFYWKGQGSSRWGYRDGFENAFLFATEKGARMRMGYGCVCMSCEILKVEITLIEQ